MDEPQTSDAEANNIDKPHSGLVSAENSNSANYRKRASDNQQKIDPMIGQIVAGRYEIIESIGAGGFGTVYKAKHLKLNSVVALKVLHADYVEDKKIAARFQHEAEIASHIRNSHITSAFDQGICDKTNVVFIAMEYVPGPSLKDAIKPNHGLDVERSIHILMQVCDGITAAHNQNILHRDIKPSNILLTNYNNDADFVKITDFGIAKVLTESTELKRLTNTETGMPAGTCMYMGPEQFKEGYKPDYRSDVYSLGCVLFELLTGDPPYNGGSPVVTVNMHTTAKIPELKLNAVDSVINSRLNNIIAKALAKEPSERYQGVSDLRADLEKVQLRIEQLKLGKTNGILLFMEGMGFSIVRQLKHLLSHLYIRRLTYSKFTTFSICALIVLIVLLFASSILGAFGSHYDMQYQPLLREAAGTLPSQKVVTLFVEPKDRLELYLADADAVRRSGDLRLALTLYDKAESKASKLDNVHQEMARYWLGRMICCLFLDRPKLTIACAPVCFGEFANIPNSSSNINLGIAHAFYAQALRKVGKADESAAEFRTFTKIFETCIQQSDIHSSDELAYACGFAGLFYEKEGDSVLAELLLERSGDYWKTIGLPGKYNLAITHMNLSWLKIKTNQYQEASDLLENAIADLNQSGDIDLGFKNKLRLYALNLRLKIWIPVMPMFS